MGRVPQQRHPAGRPPRQRRTVQQGPAPGCAAGPDQVDQAAVPAVELGEELLDGGGRRPRLDGVVPGRGEGDQVDQPAGRDRVVHQVVAGADPDRLRPAAGERRRAGGRDQGPERAEAGIGHRRGPAQDGVDAVRPDHHVGLDHPAVLEPRPRTVRVHAGAAPAEPDHPGRDRAAEDLEQVGAVDRVRVLAVEPLAGGRQILGRQHRPVPPPAELPADVEAHRPGQEPLQHAEPAQQAHRVGRDDQAGADLFELTRLLVDGDGEPGPVQERGGGEPSDPATDNHDRRHPAIMTGRGGIGVPAGNGAAAGQPSIWRGPLPEPMEILRGLAFSTIGMRRVSTPLS